MSWVTPLRTAYSVSPEERKRGSGSAEPFLPLDAFKTGDFEGSAEYFRKAQGFERQIEQAIQK
jgi:hypothetical protein